MLLPPVVVEVVPPFEQPELAASMLDACSQAVVETDCELASDEPQALPPSAVVIVSRQGGRRVRIEVGIRRDGKSEWLTRKLAFDEGDPQIERYRAVGFVIGTLAGELSDELSAPVEPAMPEVLTPESKPSQTRLQGQAFEEKSDEESPREGEQASDEQGAIEFAGKPERGPETWNLNSRGWIEVGFITGPGFDQGAFRTGAELRLGVELINQSFMFGGASVAQKPSDEAELGAVWSSGFIGLGIRWFQSASFGFDARAAVELMRLDASIASATLGVDSDGRWLFGARMGVDAHAHLTNHFGAVVGLDVRWLSGATDITIARAQVASQPMLGGQLLVGIRVRL